MYLLGVLAPTTNPRVWSIPHAVTPQVKENLRDVLRSGVEKAVWQGMPAMDDYCVMLR